MSHVTPAPMAGPLSVEIPSIPAAQLAPWLFFAGLLGVLAIVFVGAEQGAFSVFSGTMLHEFVHDGRHLLGYPCH
ncbi:CbtB-domain containing protein [Nocardioides psychrotolerans]|uniref:CbtB domain-containing protein n=1 Tax=Nocardioides psychrotolerans TaxID=1005945 RepID=UPI00313800AF